MRIAVLADTHDRYPPGLPERLRPADEIWHLGDVCHPAVLVEFERRGPPLRVVFGNSDWHAGWPRELRLRRGGVPPGFAWLTICPGRLDWRVAPL